MTIRLDPSDDETRTLWLAVGDLVDRLPGDWVLIGGLMVQLHGAEAGMTDIRPTGDIDVLAQARPPGALQAIARNLEDPRAAAMTLKRSERRWLRDVAERLDFDGYTRLDAAVVRRARLAYRLLTA